MIIFAEGLLIGCILAIIIMAIVGKDKDNDG